MNPDKRKGDFFLVSVDLDDTTSFQRSETVEHECKVAIYDLIECNYFAPVQSKGGPYRLRLGVEDNRLLFDIATKDNKPHGRLLLSLSPFRKLLKDYFLVCQSYWKAMQAGSSAHVEAIDMGRRGLHDDGSRLLQGRLAGKIDVDWETSRRLFTLICALHINE